MKKKSDPEMIDKENPEWTDAMFGKVAERQGRFEPVQLQSKSQTFAEHPPGGGDRQLVRCSRRL